MAMGLSPSGFSRTFSSPSHKNPPAPHPRPRFGGENLPHPCPRTGILALTGTPYPTDLHANIRSRWRRHDSCSQRWLQGNCGLQAHDDGETTVCQMWNNGGATEGRARPRAGRQEGRGEARARGRAGTQRGPETFHFLPSAPRVSRFPAWPRVRVWERSGSRTSASLRAGIGEGSVAEGGGAPRVMVVSASAT